MNAVNVTGIIDAEIKRIRGSGAHEPNAVQEKAIDELRAARDAVAMLIGAADALAPRYCDTTTVRGRQEMGRRLRTLAAAIARVRGEA